MSTTYSFVCDDCKIRCWCGQNTFIYKYQYVADFLHCHTGHKLRFLNDHIEDAKSENYNETDESFL